MASKPPSYIYTRTYTYTYTIKEYVNYPTHPPLQTKPSTNTINIETKKWKKRINKTTAKYNAMSRPVTAQTVGECRALFATTCYRWNTSARCTPYTYVCMMYVRRVAGVFWQGHGAGRGAAIFVWWYNMWWRAGVEDVENINLSNSDVGFSWVGLGFLLLAR